MCVLSVMYCAILSGLLFVCFNVFVCLSNVYACLCELHCVMLYGLLVSCFCPPRLCVFGFVAVVVCFVCDVLCDGVWFVCW